MTRLHTAQKRNFNSEDLSQNAARPSLSHIDAGQHQKVVPEMLSAAQYLVKLTLAVAATPFEDDVEISGNVDSQSSESPAFYEEPRNSLKRRRSFKTTTTIAPKKVHKRKIKWTAESVALQFFEDAKRGLFMKSLQYFVLNVLKAESACRTPLFELSAPWKLPNVVFAFVPELQESDFGLAQNGINRKDGKDGTDGIGSETNTRLRSLDPHNVSASDPLSFIKSNFKHIVPTIMPESMPSPISLLLLFPYSKAAKKKRAAETSQVKLVLSDLLLTKAQMEANMYPLHSLLGMSLPGLSISELSLSGSCPNQKLEEGWVETAEFDHEGSHTFALDCEFCQAESGKVLARISIVNFQSEVVYDQLVKPHETITDYMTKYSGITAEMLSHETITLKDVQKKVLLLVSSSDILIGHSLNSDLAVIKIRHPKIIDTALLFDHHRGHPFKHALKYLADVHLARSIQNGEKDGTGHSSVEDLRACLDLVKLKLIEGPDFGKRLGVPLFTIAREANPGLESSLVDYLLEEYNAVLEGVGEPILVKKKVSNDDAAVDSTIDKLDAKLFHLLWLRELQYNCARKSIPKGFTGQLVGEANTTIGAQEAAVSPEDRLKLLRSLDARLCRLYESLPADSLLIINTGGGDPARANYLNYVKRLFQRQIKAGKEIADFSAEELWNFDKATELQEETVKSRQGMTFVTVKQ